VTNQLVDELEKIREECRMQINQIERLVAQYNNDKVTRALTLLSSLFWV